MSNPAMHAVVLTARAVMLAEQECLAGMRNLADFTELCRLSENLLSADRNLALARKQLTKQLRIPARRRA